MKDKVLISFSTYNQPWFLQHAVETFERINPGYPCELLIWDNSNTDTKSLKLLEQYSKKYRVQTRPNIGRAQGAYNQTWQENKDYPYYFFMHDDVAFIRNGWLKLAVDRINDDTEESSLKNRRLKEFGYPVVGKVGFQGYEWGTKYKYLRTGYNQIFHYMDPVAKILNIEIPDYCQHINDDKILYTNECLQKIGKIWNIEDWKQIEGTELWNKLDKWFIDNNLENFDTFPPTERYGQKYHKFQTISEWLNDIAPMQNGFRTHNVYGEGWCQEEEGWSKFHGQQHIVHWGDHVTFKRLSLFLRQPEEEIRKRFKDKTFLTICSNLIKKDTENMINE